MRFEKVLFITFLVGCIQFSAFAQVKFKHEKFSNAKRSHRSLVNVYSENMLRYDVKRIQIIECYGEFEISDIFNSSQFKNNPSFTSYFTSTHGKTIGNEVGENYPETLANAVYHMIQKILYENGRINVNKSDIVSNPTYKELGLNRIAAQPYDGKALHSDQKNIVSPASQMKKLPDDLGYDANEKFYQQLAKIGNDNNVQAEFKIYFKVSINETGNPILTDYKVLMDTWLDSFKKGKETVYKWKIQDSPVFELKKAIESKATLTDGNGNVDMEKFDREIMNMLKDVTEMFSYELSDQFIKYL